MSLNWDFTKCSAETEETRTLWNQIVSFLAMFTGTSTITEKNLPEVLRRMSLWEAAGGPLAGETHGPVTVETLRAFIGASWNVAPESAAKFEKRLKEYSLTCLKRKVA